MADEQKGNAPTAPNAPGSTSKATAMAPQGPQAVQTQAREIHVEGSGDADMIARMKRPRIVVHTDPDFVDPTPHGVEFPTEISDGVFVPTLYTSKDLRAIGRRQMIQRAKRG